MMKRPALYILVAIFFVPVINIFAVDSLPSGISGLPTIKFGLTNSNAPTDVVNTIKIVALLTILTLAPAILIMMTSFTRIVVVLSFLRQAIGTNQLPPNQLIIGLALFLTFFVMAPVGKIVNKEAIEPYLNKQITQEIALEKALSPIREFMFAQTRNEDLMLFLDLTKSAKPKSKDDVSTFLLVPAFMISELKTAFQIGFLLYVPFLILDMVVASVLMAMGMMMLPPVIISLPFKIMLFVLVDGWQLVVGSLVKSFN
jgi:flagellar biosynthesis protein FliP